MRIESATRERRGSFIWKVFGGLKIIERIFECNNYNFDLKYYYLLF